MVTWTSEVELKEATLAPSIASMRGRSSASVWPLGRSRIVAFALLFCTILASVSAQSECNTADGTTCAHDGSTNEVYKTLTYSTETGKFSGKIVTNLCADHAYGDQDVHGNGAKKHQASCVEKTFPDSAYESGPSPAPLLGPVGMSYSGGIYIYGYGAPLSLIRFNSWTRRPRWLPTGQASLNSQALTNFENPPTRRPFEAGFRKGQICDDGDCAAGTDVPLCEEELSYECGGSYDTSKLLDSCGGHAKPYHYHTDLTCNYNSSDSSKHSPLIGIALDGHGIYGLHEGTAAAPVLDACGGHYGNVSGDFSENGELGEHCAYHFHTTTSAPFTVGCFGPVSSLDECRALFPDTCGDGEVSITTANGTIQYDLFCPCYQHSTEVPASCPGALVPAPAPTIDACLEGVGACLDYIKDARTQGGDSAAFGGFGGTLVALVALAMAALAALQ